MSKYKQWGKNIMFPEEIETWKTGEKLPEWLSDQCRVHFNDVYELEPVIIKNSSGYSLLCSGFNSGNLISTDSDTDYIARDIETGKLLVISEKGLKLMYNKKST